MITDCRCQISDISSQDWVADSGYGIRNSLISLLSAIHFTRRSSWTAILMKNYKR